MAKKISIASNKEKSTSVKEKKTWPEELWQWMPELVKWIADMIFNTLVLGTELVRAWTSKISQVVWSEDPEIVSSRKKITKHHLKQSGKSIKKVWTWAWNTIKWTYHTTKWTIRTAILSWKETVKWLRDVDDEGKFTKKTA